MHWDYTLQPTQFASLTGHFPRSVVSISRCMQGWHRHGLNRCSPSKSIYIPIVKTAPFLLNYLAFVSKVWEKNSQIQWKPYIFHVKIPQTYRNPCNQGLLPVRIIALLLGFRTLSFLCLRLVIRTAYDVDLGPLGSASCNRKILWTFWDYPKISQILKKTISQNSQIHGQTV